MENGYLSVQISQLVVKQSDRQTAESQVRGEARLAGEQRLRCHFRPTERRNPRLALEVTLEPRERFRFPAVPNSRHQTISVETWTSIILGLALRKWMTVQTSLRFLETLKDFTGESMSISKYIVYLKQGCSRKYQHLMRNVLKEMGLTR